MCCGLYDEISVFFLYEGGLQAGLPYAVCCRNLFPAQAARQAAGLVDYMKCPVLKEFALAPY